MPQLKFDEAIAFYKQKLPLPTEVWEQVIDESQDWAFTIAGVEKANVLQSVFDLILKVLEGRSNTVTTFEDFATNFNDLMVSGGYGEQKTSDPASPKGARERASNWRSRLVFGQNIKTAYNAGRYRTQTDSEAIKRRPYLQYIHDHPIVPRPHHKALHLKIWRADDPIWNSIYCPNGFGCECQIQSLSERDMQQEGLKVSEPITERINLSDRLTGKISSVPAIKLKAKSFELTAIPPGSVVDGDTVLVPIAELGFNYAPGASLPEQREEILSSAIARLSPRLQREIRNAE